MLQGFERVAAEDVRFDIQATAYIHAARELGHGDCAFEFHSMSKMSKTSKSKAPAFTVTPAERTPRDLDRLFTIARDAERLVEAWIYLPAAPGWQCATCAYGDACRKAYAGKAAA